MSRPLEDYGVIGNMLSAAMIGIDGSIDWLCLPRFDSPACFAALLGTRNNGRWLLAPKDRAARASHRYLPGTAVLETRFETATGAVTITDFMPLSNNETKVDVVRLVHCERGEVAMAMELVLRFNYGQVIPWVTRRDYGLSAVAGPDAVELHAPVALEGREMATHADFVIRQGESVPFTLSYHPSHKEPRFVHDSSDSLARTVEWWNAWSVRCKFPRYRPHWHDAVLRSLITLKLLTYEPTGGIVAAHTASLPEAIGGPRNWDYRYCWLRDSALTLYALVNSGYRSEAEAWRRGIRNNFASCMASKANVGCPRPTSRGLPATRAANPSASATLLPTRFSSTFSARFLTRSMRRARSASARLIRPASSRPCCSSTWRASGNRRAAASGKSAGRLATSPTLA